MKITKEIQSWVKKLPITERREALIFLYINFSKISDLSMLFNTTEEIIINVLKQENVFEYKICTRCGHLKPFSEYRLNDNSLYSHCKTCCGSYYKKYYKQNFDKIRSRVDKYMETYLDDPDAKDKHDKYIKEYNSRPEVIEKAIINRKVRNQRLDVKEKRNIYQRERKRTDVAFRLRHNISNRVTYAIKNGKSITDVLPYSLVELKEHLESLFDSNMSWENYGSYWEIDHIKPLSSFDITDISDEDFKIAWGLANLQPLEKTLNRQKSNKIDPKWNNDN